MHSIDLIAEARIKCTVTVMHVMQTWMPGTRPGMTETLFRGRRERLAGDPAIEIGERAA